MSHGAAANFERPPVPAMAVWVDDERRAPAHVLYVDDTLAWRGSGRERSPGGLGDEDFRADGGGSGTGRRRPILLPIWQQGGKRVNGNFFMQGAHRKIPTALQTVRVAL